MPGKEEGQEGPSLEVHVLVRGLLPRAMRRLPRLGHVGSQDPYPEQGQLRRAGRVWRRVTGDEKPLERKRGK